MHRSNVLSLWRLAAASLTTMIMVGCAPTVQPVAGSEQPVAVVSDTPSPLTSPLTSPPPGPLTSPPPGPAVTPTPMSSPDRSPAPAATQPAVLAASEPPSWFRQRLLDVTATGFPAPQDAPIEYLDRRLITIDRLPRPTRDAFGWTATAIPDELVARSTWREGCPTTLEELRYVTATYWGFDGLHHTGELIMHADVVDTMEQVFRVMHDGRFPLEQVALLEPMDFYEFHRRGDDNITAMYECRASTGSSRWSQHAFGRAIDINPFHNPYRKQTSEGLVILPAYATAYVDRADVRPGMIIENGPIVAAFDAAGWGWGGRWNTLKDWQHFSAAGS
ncbi:MAG: hypothetical protein ACI970_000519 [Myxococcota bacterium]|jgi:hypothetical protein